MLRLHKKNKNKRKVHRHCQIIVNEVCRYFDDNNLGFDDKFRVTEARYKIYRVFDKHYFERVGDFDFVKLMKDLYDNKKYLEICYKESLSFDKDYRTGEEAYGYKSEDYIRERMSYISDRWNCSFRLRWILDLIDKYKPIRDAMAKLYA